MEKKLFQRAQTKAQRGLRKLKKDCNLKESLITTRTKI